MLTFFMKNYVFLISLFYSSFICVQMLNNSEQVTVLSLGTYFSVSSCVVVGDFSPNMVGYLAKSGVFTNLINFQQLEQLLSGKGQIHVRRLMVMTRLSTDLNRYLIMENSSMLLWIIWVDNDENYHLLANIYVPFNVDFFLVRSNGSLTKITEWYNIRQGTRPISHDFGMISSDGSYYLTKGDVRLRRRQNFQGNSLHYSPSPDIERIGCGKNLMLEAWSRSMCYHGGIIRLMSHRMNFSINIVECSDPEYVYVYPNGSYSGLFRMLINRETDVAGGSFVVMQNRIVEFDFVWPTYTVTLAFYVEGTSKSIWNAYLKPFDVAVWHLIGITIILSATLSFLIQIHSIQSDSTRRGSGFVYFFLNTLYIFSNQVIEGVPRANSARITFLSTFVLVVILYPIYSGFLAAILTIYIPDLPFDSLDGFFENGRYKATYLQQNFISYQFELFLAARNYTKEEFVVSEKPSTIYSALLSLCKRKFAYVGVVEDMKNFQSPGCRLIKIPVPVMRAHMGLGLPRNSPYTEVLSRQLLFFRSSGIAKRMTLHTPEAQFVANFPTGSKFPSVSVEKILLPFSILGCGFVLAILIFVFENQFINVQNWIRPDFQLSYLIHRNREIMS